MRRRVWVLVGAVVLCSSTVAWPCSGPVCEDMFRGVPAYPFSIPANAPAVGVQTALFSERNWDGGDVEDDLPSCGCQTGSFAWAPLAGLLIFWRRARQRSSSARKPRVLMTPMSPSA